MHETIDRFLDYIRYERNQSLRTIESYSEDLVQYQMYVEQELHESFSPTTGDRDIIRGFLSYLIERGLKSSSVHRKLSALKSYYRYLVKVGLMEQSPARFIKGPKGEAPLPAVLSHNEMEQLLSDVQLNENDFESVRDQLILEMLYETGMRRTEMASLMVEKVDLSRSSLRVLGKGNKERDIPFGARLSARITQYLHLRSAIAPLCGIFFVTLDNEPLGGEGVYRIVHNRLACIPGLARRGPHVFRHSFATEMLNHGADLMAVKELLGHKSIATTVRYTHTSLAELQNMYNAHPRAMKPKTTMEVRIQSVHFTASSQLEEFIQKKLDRLERFNAQVIRAEVTLRLTKGDEDRNKEAAIRLEIPGADVYAEKQAATFEEAVDLVADALKRQLEKAKEQR